MTSRATYRERVPLIVMALLTGLFLAYLTPRVATIVPYRGYAAILDAHRFLGGLRREFGSHIQLVVTRPPDLRTLNRYPEIAPSPIGGAPGYIFPYLSALNGTDFIVTDRATFCQGLVTRADAALLTPAVAEPLRGLEVVGRQLLVPLERGYGVLIPVRGFFALEDLLDRRPANVRMDTRPFDLSLLADQDAAIIAESPEIYLLMSKAPTFVLTTPVAAWADRAGELRFDVVRGQDRFAAREVRVVGPGARLDADDADRAVVVVDLGRAGRVEIDFGEQAYSLPLGGYVTRVAWPTIRTPALPTAERFSVCRPVNPAGA